MYKRRKWFYALLISLGFLIGWILRLKKEYKHGKRKLSSFYLSYGKRFFDIICAFLAIILFGWLYIVVAILVKKKLGSPIIFTQFRPGKDERIFKIYKFRTMTEERDGNGELLPDAERMTPFGKWLRATSLDELPEVFNILIGDMSVVGPRPQLVRDMVFMTKEQRERHLVKPGLTGLAQVNGRNNINWEEKLDWDLKYIKRITFRGDLKIIFQTVVKALVKQEGITKKGMATAEDLGDYLLKSNQISIDDYLKKRSDAEEILKDNSK